MSARRVARKCEPPVGAQRTGLRVCEVHGAADAARRFVEDYVRYRDGRLAASRIRGAATTLRRALQRDTAPTAWPVRRRRARIAELHTQLDGPRARACARVTDDHAAVVRIAVALERRDGAWEAVDVSER